MSVLHYWRRYITKVSIYGAKGFLNCTCENSFLFSLLKLKFSYVQNYFMKITKIGLTTVHLERPNGSRNSTAKLRLMSVRWLWREVWRILRNCNVPFLLVCEVRKNYVILTIIFTKLCSRNIFQATVEVN